MKNELRLGNYLKYLDTTVQVKSIFKTHFVCENLEQITIGNSIQISYQPIPLTEEWLFKFNFKKSEATPNMYYLEGVNFELYEFGFSESDLDGFYFEVTHPYDVHVKYLHQLQNLLYILKDIEL